MYKYNVFAFAALYILFVNGQAPPPPPIVVQAGFQGTVYTPETVTAAINATVAFQFFGNVHTVTQSSFEEPCSPLPGGFHSGYIRGLNLTAPVQIWNLVVTNVNAPIWFFCATTSPTFHCSDGMVGAINPPSQAMYSQFSSAALLITTTATVNPTPTLTGQGAFASSTPTPSFSPVPNSSSPTTSSAVTLPTSTSSSTPSSTNTAAATTSHLGAIVGGAVGGSVGFIGLVLVVCWLFFLRKKRSPTTDLGDSLRYPPGRRPSEPFAEVQRPETFYPNTASVISNPNTNSFTPTDRLIPVRASGSTGPVLLQPPYIRRQESGPSDLASLSSNLPSTSGRNAPDQSSGINMRALAQEVAAVLSQNSQSAGHKNPPELRPELAVQNHDQEDASSHETTDRPPNYQAATGPSTIGLSGHGPKGSI